MVKNEKVREQRRCQRTKQLQHLGFSDEVDVRVAGEDRGHPGGQDVVEPLVGDQPGRVEGQREGRAVSRVVALKVVLQKSTELVPKK